MKDCKPIPKVGKQDTGYSILFSELLKFFPRAKAKKIYQQTKNQEFIENNQKLYQLDEHGEPSLAELIQKNPNSIPISAYQIADMQNVSNTAEWNSRENRPKYHPYTDASFRSLLKKAQKLNANNPYKAFTMAKVRPRIDRESGRTYFVVVFEARESVQSIEDQNAQMQYNEALNKKLRELCAEFGIGIDVMEQLEEDLGYSGVTDFSKAYEAADGLYHIIRLAKGMKGEKALSEEFAHAVWRAMGSIPLKDRLLNLITEEVVKEVLGSNYEKYSKLYENSFAKLQEEVAGKLLAKHFLQQAPIPQKPYRTILQRIIDYVKRLFSRMDETKVQSAIIEADKAFGVVAKNILKGKLNNKIKLSNLQAKHQLYQITEQSEKLKQLLESTKNKEIIRYNIYKNRARNDKFSSHSEVLLANIEKALEKNEEFTGILYYLQDSAKQIAQLHKRLDTLQADNSKTLNEKAKVLKSIRDYYYSYSSITSEIMTAIEEDPNLLEGFNSEQLKSLLYSLQIELGRLNTRYVITAMEDYVEFLKPYIGEGIKIKYGKFAGKTLVVDTKPQDYKNKDVINIARFALEDISFFDLWLDSASDSSSYIVSILDQAIKKSKNEARLKTIEMSKRIDIFIKKYEQLGITDYEFAFEVDENGNKTGKYKKPTDYTNYVQAKMHQFKQVRAKYGTRPTKQQWQQIRAEHEEWVNDNTVQVGNKRVPNNRWNTKDFDELSKVQQDFLREFIDIKEELEKLLPEKNRSIFRNIMIRKDLFERIKDNPANIGKSLWESVKDAFISRSDDIDLVSKKALKDFQGREVNVLPIYYTDIREGESYNDISTDIGSTLTAYAAMAYDFNEMSKVVDILELSRDMLELYQVQQNKGNKPLIFTTEVEGNKVEQPIVKIGNDTNIKKRVDKLYEMQVYSKYLKDEGNFGNTNISKAKTADALNMITAINNLAFNLLSDISNVATGNVMMRIESASQQFFTQADTRKADVIYAGAMKDFMGDIGSRFKTSKIFLWDEYFNVLQDYEENIGNRNMNRRSRLMQLTSESPGYILRHAGEHWMQNRTSLALAQTIKMKDSQGDVHSLWDSFEVKYYNEKGELVDTNEGFGGKLVLKEGYTKENGEEFTQEDMYRFMQKVVKINQHMHGIYNKIDRSAVQQLAVGRLALAYRKYLKPALNRRFAPASKDFDLDIETEGYYQTAWFFLKQLSQDIKDGQWQMAVRWENLDDYQKGNIRKALKEMEIFLLILAATIFMDFKDFDDKDNPWALKILAYQTKRLYTEIGALTPTPAMLSEGLKILKSPAAAINTAESALALIGCLNPFAWVGEDAIIQTGRFKGKTRGYRLLMNSPLVPTTRTWYRVTHPEEAIKYFN